MFRYTIIIEKAKGNYSAYCPDLPGCIATGRTEEETIKRMKEAFEFHIEGLRKRKYLSPHLLLKRYPLMSQYSQNVMNLHRQWQSSWKKTQKIARNK